jgi:hypothetical protein
VATLTKPIEPSGQRLALVMICLSSGMAILIFILARFDHDMKLLALGNVLGQVTALMSTASTMLVGRDFSSGHTDLPPGDFPAGTKVSSTLATDVQLPPAPTEPTP